MYSSGDHSCILLFGPSRDMAQFPAEDDNSFLRQTIPFVDVHEGSYPGPIISTSCIAQETGLMPFVIDEEDASQIVSRQPLGSCHPFQACFELPQFHVSYRWWEDEAATILYGFSIEDIKSLIRFGLNGDDNLSRAVLQSRNAETVADFLASLLRVEEKVYVSQLTHLEKVEQILLRCQAKRHPPRPWSWLPVCIAPGLDIEVVAAEINSESYAQFRTIPFEDWVSYGLGYRRASVEWFLLQHQELSVLISTHIDAFPADLSGYLQVEKYLRSGSPFAHQALLQCLQDQGVSDFGDMASQTLPSFDFLVGPVQELFKNQLSRLSPMLKKLSVLAVRFERKYYHEPVMDWASPFEVESPFLDDVFASTSPTVLARTLTHSDERDFANLSIQSFVTEGPILHRLMRKWDVLCKDVEECCLAQPYLVGHFKDTIGCLYALRNYHSATALLHGLQKAVPNPFDLVLPPASILSHETQNRSVIFDLVDPTDDYSVYRKTIRENPGLPFLLPHLSAFRKSGQEAELFGVLPVPGL